MGFETDSGRLPAAVRHNGVVGATSGQPLVDADYNGDAADIQAAPAYALLAGVMAGGVLAAAGLNVTVPTGTVYYARQVWKTAADIVIAVPDASTTYLWGCSDGQVRQTGTSAAPGGFDDTSACILGKAVAAAGTATVSGAFQQHARYADPVGRTVGDGPITLDYGNGRAAFTGIVIPSLVADPAVMVEGMVWFRSDTLKMSVYTGGAVKRSAAYT